MGTRARLAYWGVQNPDNRRVAAEAEELATAVYDYTPSHTRNAPVTPPLPSLEILARIPTASQHASMNDPP